jgi:hypothetical protein
MPQNYACIIAGEPSKNLESLICEGVNDRVVICGFGQVLFTYGRLRQRDLLYDRDRSHKPAPTDLASLNFIVSSDRVGF